MYKRIRNENQSVSISQHGNLFFPPDCNYQIIKSDPYGRKYMEIVGHIAQPTDVKVFRDLTDISY